jgi:hypothetical protein
MTVVNGLPAHALLVHFIVVLAPLTALLVMLCALWGAARRHLVWLTLVLAIVTTVLTPITIEAGQWLFDLRRNPQPDIARARRARRLDELLRGGAARRRAWACAAACGATSIRQASVGREGDRRDCGSRRGNFVDDSGLPGR